MNEQTLEQVSVDGLRADFESRYVPGHVGQDDFGRKCVNESYVSGFGAAITLARRLEREPAERRAAILERMEAEVWALARKAGGSGPTS